MTYEQKALIRHWYEKAQNEEGVFDQFISLWISFNGFYAAGRGIKSESAQLSGIVAGYKLLFSNIVAERHEIFDDFKKYIDEKKSNPEFIQDMRVTASNQLEEKYKKRYINTRSLCEFIDCIYQIRCNLFHGSKALDDAQDEKLVTHAYKCLLVFLKELYKQQDILT